MGTGTAVETSQDRKALVADAGFGQLSVLSALSGASAAVGLLAVTAGAVVLVARAVGRAELVRRQWMVVDPAEGLAAAAALLVAFAVGGYAAGRMARRGGLLHGGAAFILGFGAVVLAVVGTGLALSVTAVVAGTVAMFAGALAGGALGERWHEKLLGRALDPGVGAEAEARRTAEVRAADAERIRTGAFRRARRATPTRTRRVDGEAATTAGDEAQPARAPRRRLAARLGARTG